MPKVKHQIKIDGKVYTHWSGHLSKGAAQEMAKGVRKTGRIVRVVRTPNEMYLWSIYARNK